MAKEKDDSAAGADEENQKESLGVRDDQNQGGKGRVVLVKQFYSESVEEFDVAYKEDLVKMKEMGLPLGFLNVSSYKVDANNGLVELPVRAERWGKGRK